MKTIFKYKKYFFAIVVAVMGWFIFSHHQNASSDITYFKAMYNPYYVNPRLQSINEKNINIIIPSKARYNGEYYIGQSLKAYFKNSGRKVKIFSTNNYYRKKNFEYLGKSINIYLLGWINFYPNISGINIAYLLYPSVDEMSKNDIDVYKKFDLVAVGSEEYVKKMSKLGINAVYIPQFTTIDIFFPEKSDTIKSEVLFVGSAYYGVRKAVLYASRTGLDIDVYGKYWEKYFEDNPKIKEYYKGSYIDNNELHKYYSSAKIVLNDHREDMENDDFVSNRIYDVTASGGFLISDYLPSIEKIYQDSIPMYKNEQELAQLVKYYLEHPEEREAKAKKAHEITMQHFTLNKVGEMFDKYINLLLQKYRQANGVYKKISYKANRLPME